MTKINFKTYRLIIKGKVQNVGFRHWFSDLAISLGLNGYIQNGVSFSDSKNFAMPIVIQNFISIIFV